MVAKLVPVRMGLHLIRFPGATILHLDHAYRLHESLLAQRMPLHKNKEHTS